MTESCSLMECVRRWRMRWLPFRTHYIERVDFLGNAHFSTPEWQWPEVFGRPLR